MEQVRRTFHVQQQHETAKEGQKLSCKVRDSTLKIKQEEETINHNTFCSTNVEQ